MAHLSDLIVLSLEQATVLPFLTQRLARDGMRVIRLEAPGRGDPNRHVGRDVLGEPGMASYFFANNCGKQAVTLNLSEAEGRAMLHDLIAKLPVDIFATNNRPSSYARLGIDYETIQAIRPQIIWLGVTGFGPDCDEGAYDPVLQARCGWMDLTGAPDGEPFVLGLPMVDLGAAEHAYGALMKALYQRATSGEGSRIDISMFHSALTWMVSPIMLAALGERITRHGNTHPFFAPASVYPTRDGYAYVAVGNDRQWEAMTQLPGFESLADAAYARNAGRIADVKRLNQRVSDCTRQLSTDSLIAVLTDIGVPVAKVNTLSDVLADPLLRDAFTRARDPRSGLEVILPPVAEVSNGGPAELAFPPRLGEHNQAIYGDELGYGADRLSSLRNRGVI
jgi:crotonobetainyl-CoA:carnitine CoA-transferase CaiB-like acyl-CoA transferase